MTNHPSDFAPPVPLRAIIARPDVAFDYEDNLPTEHCPHWLQIECANDRWLTFEGIFIGKVALRSSISETPEATYQAIQRAGLWAMRNPAHPVLRAISARMPYVHYLAAGPDVLHHDPARKTITVPGVADNLTIISDTAGRDIDAPTTFSGLIAVTYDHVDEHPWPERPRIKVLHWAASDETFDDPDPLSRQAMPREERR